MKTTLKSPEKSSGSPFRSRGKVPFVQKKSVVNQPGDLHEREADRAAQDVAGGNPVSIAPTSYNQMGESDIHGTEDKMGNIRHERAIQRKEETGEADITGTEDKMGAVQRKEEPMASPATDVDLPSKLSASKGNGAPLEGNVKERMESGFGADFSGVRVHTGSDAADMNKSLAAKAFTNDADIYFNQGNYDPSSRKGGELLAHELTHTIQQGAASPKKQNKKPLNKAEISAAKEQAKDTPGMEQKGGQMAAEIVSTAKDQQGSKTVAEASAGEKTATDQKEEEKVKEADQAIEDKNAQEKKEVAGEQEGKAPDSPAGKENIETLDKEVEKEVSSKTKGDAPAREKQKGELPKKENEKDAGKQTGEGGKKEEDPGPDGVKEDYENPPAAKDAKVEEATDKAGEGVGVDEEANVNVEGLIMTAQQFRDQGKESVTRARVQTDHRLTAEKKMKEIQKKVDSSDKTLATAEKNTAHREKQIPKIMDRALATSRQRQEKVSGEVGGYTAEYNKNKATANDLKKESSDLNDGSKENSNPDEKESGELSSGYEEMSSGSATMAEGISGGGSTAAKLAGDAKIAKSKNASTEKDLKDSKANIRKSKQKISSEKNRNKDAKSKLKALGPKFKASQNQEEQLTTSGMELMKTSFEMENETHRAQYFYYKDMKTIEGSDEMIMQEELRSQSELSSGPEALMFRYANLKSESEKDAFLASLNESDRMMLGLKLQAFNMSFEPWIEAKKAEFGERVEQRRAEKIDKHNAKRNKGLQSPLDKATKNIDKISKTGLLWTSMTKSLEAMWEGLKNVTWADVAKIGWAMVNPLETYNTIADAVGGIWTDLSNWEGFSEDPVGMILQKGSSVGVKLLTIAGVITGLLLTLSIVTGIAAVFFPPLWVVVGWLASATTTMTSVTLWIGIITTALSVMSGIKNIFNVHTAKTAEEIYQGNNKIKKDAANTAAGVMGIVGAKSPPMPIDADKITKFKNVVKRTWKAGKGFMKGGVRKIPRLVSSTFKKETWSNLYASFKKFNPKKSGNMSGNNKGLLNKTDNVTDAAPKKVLKNAGGDKTPQTTPKKIEKKLPEKQKPLDVDNKTPTKQPDIDPDVPVTKAPDLRKVDTDLPDANLKKVDTDLPDANLKKVNTDVDAPKTKMDEVDTDVPKDKQVANGEKPAKSDLLEDDPHLKDKDLDKFKKYEDDVDASKKKKMKEDADGDVDKGKNHDSKAKALVMARIIAETNDRVDTPVPILMGELAPLKVMKGVTGFKAEGELGEFKIYMLGSKYLVDGKYTDSGPLENRVVRKSKKGYSLLEGNPKSGWRHIIDKHITGRGSKDLFPKGLSPGKIKDLIIESVDSGVTIAKQGNRLEIIYKLTPAKYGIKEMRVWVNSVTREIETAYPTKGPSVFENVIQIP